MTKDNTGIKSLLSTHTPRRVVAAKKPRPTVQEMLEQEDLKNIYDPFWWIPDTPVETPEDTSKATPKKEKKERTDKIYKHSEMMRWLTRPPSPYEKATKKKIVEDHYKKAEQPKKKMSIVRYINKINSLYNNSEETPENKYPVKPTERFNDRTQEQDRKQKARNNTTREKTDGQV